MKKKSGILALVAAIVGIVFFWKKKKGSAA